MTAEKSFLKILLFAGLLLVVLGIAFLVVPVPHSETQGIKAGDINIGAQTSHSERVSPIMSAAPFAVGIARFREDSTGEVWAFEWRQESGS